MRAGNTVSMLNSPLDNGAPQHLYCRMKKKSSASASSRGWIIGCIRRLRARSSPLVLQARMGTNGRELPIFILSQTDYIYMAGLGGAYIPNLTIVARRSRKRRTPSQGAGRVNATKCRTEAGGGTPLRQAQVSRTARAPGPRAQRIKRQRSGLSQQSSPLNRPSIESKHPVRLYKNGHGTSRVILHLICASDAPAAKTWSAFHCVTEAMGVSVDGSWSDRSARLIALEGAFAAEEMIIEDFSDAPGTLPTRPSPL